jgi:hypothetical protein
MNKVMHLDINVGLGDHLIVRFFLDQIKDQFQSIQVTHSRPAMSHWRNDDPAYWKFIYALGDIVFSEPPYQLVKQPIHFPFWPSERFIELGFKPKKPNIPGMIVNHNLTPVISEPYIILTTKVREMKPAMFAEFIQQFTPVIKKLATKYTIVLLGEREVEKSKEYLVADNPTIIFSAYQAFKALIPDAIDLTIPALGIQSSDIKQVQHDCYLMSKASAVLTLGVGGNVWISAISAPLTLCLRADSYKVTELFQNSAIPELYMTRNISELCQKLEALYGETS